MAKTQLIKHPSKLRRRLARPFGVHSFQSEASSKGARRKIDKGEEGFLSHVDQTPDGHFSQVINTLLVIKAKISALSSLQSYLFFPGVSVGWGRNKALEEN